MRKDCIFFLFNILFLFILGGNNEDKKYNFGNDSLQIVFRKGEFKFFELLFWYLYNK